MNGLTNYITEWNWNEIITTWYVWVDDMYQIVTEKLSHPLRSRVPVPRMSDSEVITVSLIIETFFQGHEEVGYAFTTQYLRDMFPDLVDLDRFNARRRRLIVVWNRFDDYYAIRRLMLVIHFGLSIVRLSHS